MGNSSSMQQKVLNEEQQQQPLLPGLPDEIALQILALVSHSYYPALRRVSRSWNSAISSNYLLTLRRRLGTSEHRLYLLLEDDQTVIWLSLDHHGSWYRIPPPPLRPPRPPSLITRFFTGIYAPLKSVGCSIAQANGFLYAIGGFFPESPRPSYTTTSSVWRYDPTSNRWSEVSPMTTPRAYCKTGVIGGLIYAVGGLGNKYSLLDSAEVYNPVADSWTPVAGMAFPGYQSLLPFIPQLDFPQLEVGPLASAVVELGGKLLVAQCRCSAFLPLSVGGEIFDPVTGSWAEMPRGLGGSWPEVQHGMKVGTVVDGRLLSLDHRTAGGSGCRLLEYDGERDYWRVVVDKVPVKLAEIKKVVPLLSSHLMVEWNRRLHIVVMKPEEGGTVEVLRSVGTLEAGEFEVVATRSVGSANLVGCQVLTI